MTVSEKIISMLVSNGMFESQAKEVMKLAITKLKNSIEDYTITFNSPSDQYPNIVYSILYRLGQKFNFVILSQIKKFTVKSFCQ